LTSSDPILILSHGDEMGNRNEVGPTGGAEKEILIPKRTTTLRAARLIWAAGLLALVACGKRTAGPSGPDLPGAPSNPNYDYSVTGSTTDATRATTPGYLLMGGGTDVDAAMRWLIARSGGGDILVLRATGTDAYNPYIASLGAVNSVATLVLHSAAAASDAFVLDKVRRAEALFIAGGDQSNYVSMWKDTPLADAIRAAAARGVPVGGTSAGLAVMGQFVYGALGASAESATALADPYHGSVTLVRGFLDLPGLEGMITDSHFVTRDRLGRLVAFLARIVQEGWASQARGIGVDEQTAVLVDGFGNATIAGRGAAYFVSTTGLPGVCRPGDV
jgi:cyanophycinase